MEDCQRKSTQYSLVTPLFSRKRYRFLILIWVLCFGPAGPNIRLVPLRISIKVLFACPWSSQAISSERLGNEFLSSFRLLLDVSSQISLPALCFPLLSSVCLSCPLRFAALSSDLFYFASLSAPFFPPLWSDYEVLELTDD